MPGNPSWTELATATLVHRRPKIADTVSRNNIIMYELRRRGRMRTIGGGISITTPIMIGDENENFLWYLGREALQGFGQEVMTSAEFPWKQYACAVSMSGREMLQNSGREAIKNLLAARTEHCEKTIANQMAKSANGNGTNFSGKEFGGMDLLVSPVAGATVGNINSGQYAWWDNKRASVGTLDTATINGDMLDMSLSLKRGGDKVNLITADDTWYSTFWQSLQAQQRFMDKKLAAAEHENIMHGTTPVVSDGGIGGYHPSGMRFLNLGTIELIMHRDRNNTVLKGPNRPMLEDSHTVIMAGMGNFITTNRYLNGTLTL